jgi:ribosome-binding protein aMBF1 (putative translation factor)
VSLTDAAPRDKWQRVLNARILGFELSEVWQHTIRRISQKQRRETRRSTPKVSPEELSSQLIRIARQNLKLSQRALADRLGKSQSWIRDIEKGRFAVSPADQARLREVLALSPEDGHSC